MLQPTAVGVLFCGPVCAFLGCARRGGQEPPGDTGQGFLPSAAEPHPKWFSLQLQC